MMNPSLSIQARPASGSQPVVRFGALNDAQKAVLNKVYISDHNGRSFNGGQLLTIIRSTANMPGGNGRARLQTMLLTFNNKREGIKNALADLQGVGLLELADLKADTSKGTLQGKTTRELMDHPDVQEMFFKVTAEGREGSNGPTSPVTRTPGSDGGPNNAALFGVAAAGLIGLGIAMWKMLNSDSGSSAEDTPPGKGNNGFKDFFRDDAHPKVDQPASNPPRRVGGVPGGVSGRMGSFNDLLDDNKPAANKADTASQVEGSDQPQHTSEQSRLLRSKFFMGKNRVVKTGQDFYTEITSFLKTKPDATAEDLLRLFPDKTVAKTVMKKLAAVELIKVDVSSLD